MPARGSRTLDRRSPTQTARLTRLAGEYRVALARLERSRPRPLHERRPDLIVVRARDGKFTDLIDNLELLGRIGRQDKRIAAQVKGARDGVPEARQGRRGSRGARPRGRGARGRRRRPSSAASSSRLVASRDALVAAEQAKSATLASIEGGQADVHAEIEALEDASAELAEQIRQSQQESSSSTPPIRPRAATASSAGRSPARSSAASGCAGAGCTRGSTSRPRRTRPSTRPAAVRVINAGWLGGYGNLVVVDHGGGLSTAYAHNTSFASSVGRPVVGRPGDRVLGEHRQLERPARPLRGARQRVAVDPLGYL